jgi:Conserved hypothetical protein 2217 (DUF2460)
MATFPLLKTGAVAQYPASSGLRFQNQVLRFVDGANQRYRDSAGPLHAWEIQLSEMDEREMAEIEQFFVANQGSFASFAFTDPWNGQAYTSCSIASDELDLTSTAEMRGGVSLMIVENRT